MELIVIWLILGIVVGMIARSKGRSFILWFIYGGLLFIIAIVHVLLIGPTTDAEDRRAVAAGMKQCPDCAEWVQGAARKCRFCGAEMVPGSRRSA